MRAHMFRPEPQQGLRAPPAMANEQQNPAMPLPNNVVPPENEDALAPAMVLDDDADDAPMEFGNDEAEPVAAQAPNAQNKPNTAMWKQFNDYLGKCKKKFAGLEPEYIAAIDLINLLTEAGADLALYDRIVEWHHDHIEADKKVTYKQLIKDLRERYNMEDMVPKMKRTTLPACGSKVSIPCLKYESVARDLMTDPRIKDSDYLFFNDDPYAGPPPDSEWEFVEDINTGLCYRKTYDALIKPNPYTEDGRLKMLAPNIIYMDACNMGSQVGSGLSLELVKITSGLFNKKARNKDYCWRNLGAVPKYVASKTKAKLLIAESGHRDACDYVTDSDKDDDTEDKDDDTQKEGDGTQDEDDASQNSGASLPEMEDEEVLDEEEIGEIPTTQAQNLHHMLSIILDGYKKVQASGGIEWDLWYKGRLYRLLLLPFVIFVKGDSVEQDKHCGKYGSKGKGIQSLCRHCLCPAEETDDPYAVYPRKTQPMIAELVRKRMFEKLKGMSQSYIKNAWHELRFGLHNDWGIHGASPLEILHWIQINMFGYSRDNLFDQTGRGKLGKAFNEVATSIGWLMQRQSDKGYPRTKFTNGVMKGKLTGHEKSGMMLVLAAALRSTKGRKLLLEDSKNIKKQEFFPDEEFVDDWLMLVETQLEWEQWLKKDRLYVDEVKRSNNKVREILAMNKVVGKRTEGMGNKTFVFHGSTHYWQDILNFGVPESFNTMGDEMRHKTDKKDAQRTQKRPKTFELQAMKKIEERRVLQLGAAELNGRLRWDYKMLSVEEEEDVTYAAPGNPELSGVLANIWFDYNLGDWSVTLYTGMKQKKKFKYPPDVMARLQGVAGQVQEWCDPLPVRSELKIPGGQTYRAYPYYKGKAWYDWGLFWYDDETTGKKAVLPGQIKAIIDLRKMTMEGNRTLYEPTILLLVELVQTSPDPQQQNIVSELFVPLKKRRNRMAGSRQYERTMELFPISRLIGPTCVIPDVGNKSPDALFRVRPQKEWGDLLSLWMNEQHSKNFQDPQVPKKQRQGQPKEG